MKKRILNRIFLIYTNIVDSVFKGYKYSTFRNVNKRKGIVYGNFMGKGYYLFVGYRGLISDSISKYGNWDESMLTKVSTILSDRVGIIIDAGANIGAFAIPLARVISDNNRILCFEPHPEIFELLKKSVDLNSLTNIEVHNIGLSNSKGILDFYAQSLDQSNLGLSSFEKNDDNLHSNMVKVPVDTLDNIVLNQRVALMKVDIQGHESNLLEGSKVIIQRDAPHIILEFESEYSGCFKDFLEINKEILTGYRYYALQGGSNFLAEIDPAESYLNCDLLLIK